MQVPYFADKYHVVTIDLAGHGHSGSERKTYSVLSFARDVKAVTEDIAAKRVILIGHSMAGEIAAEAAILMPGHVIGIIGIDTLHDVGYSLDKEIMEKDLRLLREDFTNQIRSSVREMLIPQTDPALAAWILDDMSAAPAEVAISAYKGYMELFLTGKAKEIFHNIKVPVRCLNADLWPTDIEANRRYIASFEVKIMEGCGHFPMLERPDEFNRLLEQTISELSAAD
jgi:pimeloyl-ACP methyl ester carboxylesterase